MKSFKYSILGAAALLFVSAFQSFAITNTAIAISGNNLVLSWPSYGYEIYLIQYCPTLGSSNSWTALTNAFPANSTNRTTFTIGGLVSQIQDTGGGGGDDTNYDNPPPPGPGDFTSSSTTAASATPSVPMAMPADGSGSATPLAIYPPGFNLSGFVIFDPATGEWTSGNGYVVSSMSSASGSDTVAPLDATENIGGNASTGFYRVFHIPNWLINMTNYVFDGPTFIPVDYAGPDADPNYVDNTTVLINGQPTDCAQFMPYAYGGVTNWGMGIYFDRFPNGTYTIQLLSTVRQSDELNDQTPYMVFSNTPVTIAVENLINFTNWDDLIWNNANYTFRAQTISNVDWEIDIYDYNGYFVNYQTGHSSDGNISWTWDLYDYSGDSRNDDSDPYFYPYITIWQSSGAGGQAQADDLGEPDPMPAIAKSYPSTGAWLVSYMDNNFTDGRTNFTADQPYYSNGVNGIAGAALYNWNIPAELVPVKFGRAYGQLDRDDSWTNLKAWLQTWEFRNFYYFGHGWPNGFGGDINILDSSNNVVKSHTFAGSKAYINDSYIRQNITVNPYSGSHPYRFVFVDGCASAMGDLPDAFGIPKQQLTESYYRNSANTRHVRPSAFVGWNGEIGYNEKGWGTIQQLWDYRNTWVAQWSLGNSGNENLQQALNDAKNFTSWATPSQVDAYLRIYGDYQLLYRQYNHPGDWP